MPYNPNIHKRKSIRLKGYDYSQEGLYFITLCVHERKCLFGKIENGEMMLNDAGQIAHQCWSDIPNHFPQTILHEFIIMPNHIHGIIELVKPVGANNHSPNKTEGYNSPNNTEDFRANIDSPVNRANIDSPVNRANIDSPVNRANIDSPVNRANIDSPVNRANIDSPVNRANIDSPVNRANIDSPVNRANIDSPVNRANIDSPVNRANIDSPVNRANIDSPVNRANIDSPQRRSPSQTIGSVVRGFKIGVTKWVRQNKNIEILWQRNYYEHIIRDNKAYQNISNYIVNNPLKWQNDKFYH